MAPATGLMAFGRRGRFRVRLAGPVWERGSRHVMKSARGQERASGLASRANGYPSARQGLRHPRSAAGSQGHHPVARSRCPVAVSSGPGARSASTSVALAGASESQVRLQVVADQLAASTPASPAIAAKEGSRRGRSRHRVAGDAPAAQVARSGTNQRLDSAPWFDVGTGIRARGLLWQLADRKRSFLMSCAAAAMRLSWQRARGTDR